MNDRHRGPSLLVVAVIYAAFALAALVSPAVMAGWNHFPSPFQPDALQWFTGNPHAALASAFLVTCSAVPLGIYTATVTSALHFLGMKVAGIQIALYGGVAASVALATSGFAQWVLAQPGVADSSDVAHALHLLAFAAGGPGFVVPFGLLVAGVAVVAGLQRFIARWLMVVGLAIALLAELAVFAWISRPAMLLLPLARFSGLVWLIVLGTVLPKSRREARS